jgi:hypothetical protein
MTGPLEGRPPVVPDSRDGQRPSLQGDRAKLLLASGGLFVKNDIHDEARALRRQCPP